MKSLLSIYFFLLFTILLPGFCQAEGRDWCTPLQVKQIALATQLATFPLPQGELDTVLGKRNLPHFGGATDEHKRVFGIIPLTNPESRTGYYAVRIYYDLTSKRETKDIPINSAQVLYYSPEKMIFVYDMNDIRPETKKRMVEQKLTPIGFAEFLYSERSESLSTD
jgi:hypothetical protein